MHSGNPAPGDLNAAPGPELAATLHTLNLPNATPTELIDAAVALNRLASWTQALQHKVLHEAAKPDRVTTRDEAIDMLAAHTAFNLEKLERNHPELLRTKIEEQCRRLTAIQLAPALTIASITAQIKVDAAHTIVTQLPATLTALTTGKIDSYRAALIAEGTATLSPTHKRTAENHLLATGTQLPPAKLRHLIDRIVINLDPHTAETLYEQASHNRTIGITPDKYGLAKFWALLPAQDAATAYHLINTLADHNYSHERTHTTTTSNVSDGADTPATPLRGIGEHRADAFSDLINHIADTGTINLLPFTTQTPPTPKPKTTTPTGETDSTTTDLQATGQQARTERETPRKKPTESGPAPNPTPAANLEPKPRPVSQTGTESNQRKKTRSTAPATPAPTPPAPTPATPIPAPSAPDPTPNPGTATPIWRPLRPPPSLQITLNLDTLAALANNPGHLDNYGYLPAGMSRAIAASAATITVLALNNCGTLLDLGRTVRYPTTTVDKFIKTRDHTCRYPGCNRKATKNDIDHQKPWTPTNDNGGPTCPCNLASLCRTHHLTKHRTTHTVQHQHDHTLNWTTPTGHTHTSHPHDWNTTLPNTLPLHAKSANAATDERGAEAEATIVGTKPVSEEQSTQHQLAKCEYDLPPF
ncbi:HNH endonuclease [Nakamurella antarctica]|uniref:HNH endonuclease n=1 Tax=Nakamurella antarctica TaxID=1902245 RepID=A0A3G8ZKF2_9ACTN|nr:HNH endonuclease signature motif containing protein [Nakamurella antarctica]AZI57733.1 HNH endonuclease [Nakamurella antarctica]